MSKCYKKEGYIFVDESGKIISEVLFDGLRHEVGDIYCIGKNDLENYLNVKTGKLLSEEWFCDVYPFNSGYGHVSRYINNTEPKDDYSEKEFNFIDVDGNYLSENWFKRADGFKNGIATVEIDSNGENFIDTKGNIILCTYEELNTHMFKLYS